MYIEKNKITLEEDVESYFNKVTSEGSIKIFIEELGKYLKKVLKLLKIDLSRLSDEEFYDAINNIYYIVLTDKDFLDIYSIMYGKRYTHFSKIKSNIVVPRLRTKECDKNSSYDNYKVEICYEVACTDDSDIERDKCYTSNEIQNKISENKIIIVSETENDIDKINFQEENYICLDSNNIREYYNYKDSKYFSIYINLLRNKLTRKRIRRDLRVYLDNLQEQIDYILDNYQESVQGSTTLNIESLLEKFDQEKQYQLILTKLGR